MKYTDSHEWIDSEGRVGITSFAADELGEVVYVELPKVGTKLKQGDQIAVLESTKAAVDVYSPVSGTVISINAALKEQPTLLSTSPESEGWLCTLKPLNPSEFNDLLDPAAYKSLLEG